MSFDFPFEYAAIPGLGVLFYPIVRIEVHTILGWRLFEFLVDTGADVTTVNSDFLSIVGLEPSKLQKSQAHGVGGIAVKTWEFILPMRLGQRELQVKANVVKSKHDSLPLLLGRKDIFEKAYSLHLDSKRKMTTIIENN